MAQTLATTLTCVLKLLAENALDNSTPQDTLNYNFATELPGRGVLATGTGANQADRFWSDRRTLAATTENLDLAGGGLLDSFGNAFAPAKVKAIVIINRNTTAGQDLIVGGAAANQFSTMFSDASDKLKVRAGGAMILLAPIDGYAVTAAVGDILKIDAGANTVTYDIIIVGTSA